MCWFSSWDTVFGYSNVSSCMLLSHVVVQWLETGFEALCPTFEERSWRVGIDRPNIFLFLMTYVLNSFSLYMLYRSNSHSHLKRLPWVAFPHRGPLSSSQLASLEPRMSGRLPLPPPPKYPPPPKNVLWIRWKFGRKCRHFFCRTKGTQLSSHWKVSRNPWKSMFLVKLYRPHKRPHPKM